MVNDLYQTLEFDSRVVSPNEIKSSYRRLALLHHPDKNPHDIEKFREIKYAYDILNDPKKRSIYDRYGDWGINMSTTIGAPLLDPDCESLIKQLVYLISMVTVLLIIFLVLLADRLDGWVSWKFSTVFIPIWILDGVIFLGILKSCHTLFTRKPDMNHNDNNYALSGWILSYLISFIFFQLLLVIKLDFLKGLELGIVFIPIYFIEVINLIQLSIRYFKQSNPTILTFFNHFFSLVMRIIQWSLIIIKPHQLGSLPWGFVFIPTYLITFQSIVNLALSYLQYRNLSSIDEDKVSHKGLLILKGILFSLGLVLIYSFFSLISYQLDTKSYSYLFIFIPLFIILSVMLTWFSCLCPMIYHCILLTPPSATNNSPPPTASSDKHKHPSHSRIASLANAVIIPTTTLPQLLPPTPPTVASRVTPTTLPTAPHHRTRLTLLEPLVLSPFSLQCLDVTPPATRASCPPPLRPSHPTLD